MDQRLPFPCSARVQRDIQPRNHVGFITAGCRCPRVLSLWLAGRGNEACAAGGARPLVEGGCCRFGGRFASRRKDVVFVSRQETPPPPGKGRLDPSGRSVCAWLPCVRGHASNPSPQSRSAGGDPRAAFGGGEESGGGGRPASLSLEPIAREVSGTAALPLPADGFLCPVLSVPQRKLRRIPTPGKSGERGRGCPWGAAALAPSTPRSPGPPTRRSVNLPQCFMPSCNCLLPAK